VEAGTRAGGSLSAEALAWPQSLPTACIMIMILCCGCRYKGWPVSRSLGLASVPAHCRHCYVLRDSWFSDTLRRSFTITAKLPSVIVDVNNWC